MASRSQPVLASNGQGQAEPSASWEPWTLAYRDTGQPVPSGAELIDQAGRRWKFKAGYKPGLGMTRSAYEVGDIIVNNGSRRDAVFLADFFPEVQFRRVSASPASAKAGATERQPEPREDQNPSPKVTGDAS